MVRSALLLAFLTSSSAIATSLDAHDVDVTGVARVFLDELGAGEYLLSVVDALAPPIVDPASAVPERCEIVPDDLTPIRTVAGFVFRCETPLTFDDALKLPWSLAGAVVVARWIDGDEASRYFRGSGREIAVPLTQLRAGGGSTSRVSSAFFILGVEHIVFGIDHLFFVFGLLMLVQGFWSLVRTVTAFTIAHSITLAATVLGYLSLPAGPVEAAIALSIVLLAREIIVGRRERDTLVHRHPWAVALVFGLLHGFGFAGALGEIGLRSQDVPLALLSFNIGVEAGQLAFVALVVLAHQIAVRRVPGEVFSRARLPLGYALGVIATFWFLGRLPDVWIG
jgi:hydrogenase/urease accessory protein HupE